MSKTTPQGTISPFTTLSTMSNCARSGQTAASSSVAARPAVLERFGVKKKSRISASPWPMIVTQKVITMVNSVELAMLESSSATVVTTVAFRKIAHTAQCMFQVSPWRATISRTCCCTSGESMPRCRISASVSSSTSDWRSHRITLSTASITMSPPPISSSTPINFPSR